MAGEWGSQGNVLENGSHETTMERNSEESQSSAAESWRGSGVVSLPLSLKYECACSGGLLFGRKGTGQWLERVREQTVVLGEIQRSV